MYRVFMVVIMEESTALNYFEESTALSSAQIEDESELSLTLCRELIELIKSNEVLWKKRFLSYKDQQLKTLTWSTIGSFLSCKLSGKL